MSANSTPGKISLAAFAALASSGAFSTLAQLEKRKVQTKPEFTPEELEYLRSLPKKDKKRAVAELKAKYGSVK